MMIHLFNGVLLAVVKSDINPLMLVEKMTKVY